MNIQQAVLDDDLGGLRDVAAKAFSSTSDARLEEWFSFGEMLKAIHENRGVCLKAVDDKSRMAGMIYAQQENPINAKEGLDKWVIVITAVDPKLSGKGIGGLLLEAIEKKAKEAGASKIFVYTNKGDEEVIEFYHKNDYEDAGWVKDYQYGKNNSAVFLIKYLH